MIIDTLEKTNSDIFYKTIAEHYDEIFPFHQSKKSFMEQFLTPESRIIDVGSATGALLFSLSGANRKLFGIEPSETLLDISKERSKNLQKDVILLQNGMEDLDTLFEDESLDFISCVGNTLVHLGSLDEVEIFLKNCHRKLTTGGSIVIQIVNYDGVENNKLPNLPLIETESIVFERSYTKEPHQFLFDTTLTIKESGEKISNSIPLLPITSTQLNALLKKCDFETIRLYSSFESKPFDGKGNRLVVSAKKIQ